MATPEIPSDILDQLVLGVGAPSSHGTSENAVKTQILIAISVYVLVAILKKARQLDRSLGEIPQILSITLFEKDEIYQVVTAADVQNHTHDPCNQLVLFDL